jgi:hypothetical protein
MQDTKTKSHGKCFLCLTSKEIKCYKKIKLWEQILYQQTIIKKGTWIYAIGIIKPNTSIKYSCICGQCTDERPNICDDRCYTNEFVIDTFKTLSGQEIDINSVNSQNFKYKKAINYCDDTDFIPPECISGNIINREWINVPNHCSGLVGFIGEPSFE